MVDLKQMNGKKHYNRYFTSETNTTAKQKREKLQAEGEIKRLTRDIERQHATLGEKQREKRTLDAEINGKKSELSAKQAQKLAREAQLHTVENQLVANRQAIKTIENKMHDTERKIHQQNTLQQETKRLCDQAEAQLSNIQRELNQFTQQLEDKTNIYDKKKEIADNLTTQYEKHRTSQLAVDQELSQLSSTLQSHRAKITGTQRNMYTTNQYTEARKTTVD
ncbi:unnamed protein product [Adineta steineri]|uniref:Uncharacterized protein n=1 Tax=Adineta steineri TaxID=433720 RepID=A0A815G7I9_9BILA|nr:unnamed protein product [Adineta steineri]CAF1390622.1 unnamed protein product [Adineta steineri]CAF3782109.1 unnamed protein product [Adineta steineri]CAF3921487.1 unnamed protein product [Adineta steineri]